MIKAVEEAPASGTQLVKLSSFFSVEECKKHLPENCADVEPTAESSSDVTVGEPSGVQCAQASSCAEGM